MIAEFKELKGDEAQTFADEHLEKVSVNYEQWEVKYRDPHSGRRFVMDYLHPEAHGGGIPRLRPASEAETR